MLNIHDIAFILHKAYIILSNYKELHATPTSFGILLYLFLVCDYNLVSIVSFSFSSFISHQCSSPVLPMISLIILKYLFEYLFEYLLEHLLEYVLEYLLEYHCVESGKRCNPLICPLSKTFGLLPSLLS